MHRDRRSPLPGLRCLSSGTLRLPHAYVRLEELAYNLWWSWTPDARLLFASVDAELWQRYGNPLETLRHTSERRWGALLGSDDFAALYHRVLGAFDRYLGECDLWYAREQGDAASRPIAYVSTEYGLHETLPIYSGGLGVLSGDHLKAASDLGIPLVGVGLLYRRGYFFQGIDAEGQQQHRYPHVDLGVVPVRPVLGPQGVPLVVSVPLGDREISLAVSKIDVGRVPLLVLDSDIPENAPSDRTITNILYVRGRETRLCQEMLLGIGAVRALRALDVSPAAWHLNEGHSALMLLERVREEMERGLSFDDARGEAARSIAFTTHTPVPAGNETFGAGLMRGYLQPWSDRLGVPLDDLMRLGRWGEGDDPPFNLTALALGHSSFRNGVSERHAEVSRGMWQPLFGDEPAPIEPITNGVHVETWLGPEIRELLQRHFGTRWLETCGQSDEWAGLVEALPDEELWEAHAAQKRRLVGFARETLRAMSARHGESPGTLRAIETLFDPEALTIGFARRFATYKRAGMLFDDMDRARAIFGRADRPVQLLMAGKAHPADRGGQGLIARVFSLSQSDEFRGRVAFVEDYGMAVGRLLVQGTDVWLNTPRRPLEASGTSGQKASANGVLNLSILDGWWIEGYSPDVGWAIGTDPGPGGDAGASDEEVDRRDAAALYDVLEGSVLPTWFDRDESGLPREWIRRMKTAIRDLLPRFSGRRMVRDYASKAYGPLVRGTLARDSVPGRE